MTPQPALKRCTRKLALIKRLAYRAIGTQIDMFLLKIQNDMEAFEQVAAQNAHLLPGDGAFEEADR